jgi:molecular chaperone DnaK (HSP70)
LGSLNVTDLPQDKAEKVTVEVTLSIDRDEVLTVKAKELKSNKKLTAVIEKSKQLKLNIDNMVIEAIDNKVNDEKLVTKLNEIDKLIEIIRRKYAHHSKVIEKMNQIVDKIAEREQTIDINECDAILIEIKDFFYSRRASKHEQHN